jgi:hypothetical protein
VKLPNSNRLIISSNKLKNYLISETHPVGRSKAKFFRSLGFDDHNLDALTLSLKKIAHLNEIKESRKVPYGTNYVIEGIINSPNGSSVEVVTVWFIEQEGSQPRFVTAYPL